MKFMVEKNLMESEALDWESLVAHEDENVRANIARNRNCPIFHLETLAQDKSEAVRAGIAGNCNTPAAWLEVLAKDTPIVLSHVATNSNCPLHLIVSLSKHPKPFIRKAITRNTMTPVDILERLAGDVNPLVQAGVGRNPNTPLPILHQLASTQHSSILKSIVKNPKCPPAITDELSQHELDEIRTAIAKSEQTPLDTLLAMTCDVSHLVLAALVSNPVLNIDEVYDLSDILSDTIFKSFARRGDTPADILAKIETRTESTRVLKRIAEHRNTNGDTLYRISRRRHLILKLSVLEHPNCPNNVLRYFADSKNKALSTQAQVQLNERFGDTFSS